MTEPKKPAPRKSAAAPPAPDRVTREVRADDPDQPGVRQEDEDLRTQYERDQSSDSTGDQPREVMRQAQRDIDAGLVDTDLHGTPGIDAERRRELLEREKQRTTPPERKP